MAFITYVAPDTLAPGDRVADPDNIIQIHAVHPAVMRQHWELYKALMHRPGPLSRRERALLDDAEVLTLSPAAVRSSHVDALRAADHTPLVSERGVALVCGGSICPGMLRREVAPYPI